MRAGAFLYPWDVVGDPDAAPRLAALGVRQATLASAYHSVRALTPRHPRHRIVTARHSAVLYPPDPARWSGRALRPYEQRWVGSEDPGGAFGEAARALSDAGIEVHSWVVLAHNSRLGEENEHITVRNAYGDRYPWAPCIARPEVREYLVDLASEAAVRPHAGGTELESCGWYGFAHLHAHDKTGGARLDGAGQYLMSLCFCDVCEAGYASLGTDPEELRARTVRALQPVWRGGSAADADGTREGEWRAVSGLLGPDRAEACASWRDGAARLLRREAVAAVRAAAAERGGERGGEGAGEGAATGGGFRVMLHADPAPHRVGANAGLAPADAVEDADGVVVPAGGGAAERAAALGPFAAAAAAVRAPGSGSGPRTEAGPGPGAGRGAAGTSEGARTGHPALEGFTVAANFTVVSGMGGSPRTLAADAAHAHGLGAGELRLYHAGLATDSDLDAVREALSEAAPRDTGG